MDHVWLVWARTGLMRQEQLVAICATEDRARQAVAGHTDARCEPWYVNGHRFEAVPRDRYEAFLAWEKEQAA